MEKETPGWIRLAQQQQRDPRHMVAPRCTAITGACVLYRVRRMLRFWKEIQQQSHAGKDVDGIWEKLLEEHDKYREADHFLNTIQSLVVRTSQVIQLDQPNKSFLSNLLPTWETLIGSEDDGLFVDELERDWASLSQPDKLDQVIGLISTTDFGQRMFRPFLVEEENIGDNGMLHYREDWIRTLMFGGISVIIGVFACAPVAIQSLNVKSAGGEVATYLVFMIVFGWLSQALLRGFEKILLACLAYASVMAAVMRQGQ
ncbi:hypothetical protein CEP54_002343 [Fusarium duplospermum]|uniref:Uncharacterized protein n=1 Tax=Fusarium duplospermum TaxID=1325734 RepID=A0A428QVU3_9HYPO|nr:hypothetical protein CEP54_002343 [Fusarium duplospermum]